MNIAPSIGAPGEAEPFSAAGRRETMRGFIDSLNDFYYTIATVIWK